jgi:predicted CoA-binding protein
METTTLEAKVQDFLDQKRIAVAGVSRNKSAHPVGNLIYDRLKKTGHDVFAVNPNMASFEGDRCFPDLQSIPGGVDGVVIITRPETTAKGSSVSEEAVEYCRQQDISVIAGACPMMFGPDVDFPHACLRLFLKVSGSMPA